VTARAQDELSKIMFENTSPEIINDFRRILFRAGQRGRQAYKDAVSAHLNKKILKTGKMVTDEDIEVIVPGKASAALGLDHPDSDEFKLTLAMLEGTDIRVSDLRRFFDMTKKAFEMGVPTPAALARRRVMIGGIGALQGTFTLGMGAGTAGGMFVAPTRTAITAVTAWALARGFSEVITRPGALRALTRAIDPSATEVVKRQALRRMAFIIPALTARGFIGQGNAAREIEDAYADFVQIPLRNQYNRASGIVSDIAGAVQGGQP